HGPVDYWTEFTKIAYLSKINLHLTIPRIANGISQRCFDIMAAGGFLMANYRDAMINLFEPDVDFVMYTDIEELVEKAHYYLAHDKEREQIARHGCETVIKNHTCAHRAQEIIMELTEAGFTP
ncbi:MAG: glycosyltransferase, partial [Lachnospiraceae bacterium]|nr:glycosyltransferase [Lachnospiraceae bacterium]